LAHVETLLAQHHKSEALDELERLAAQHPRNYDVFAMLFEVAAQLNDNRSLLIAHIALEVTRSKCSAAQSWFDMWAGVEPEQHIVESARARCAAHHGGESLTRRELRPRSLRWRRLR
jgi:predicted Zn-dependent protease